MNALKTRATHGKYWINGNERTRTRNWTVRYGEYEDIYTRAGELLEKPQGWGMLRADRSRGRLLM